MFFGILSRVGPLVYGLLLTFLLTFIRLLSKTDTTTYVEECVEGRRGEMRISQTGFTLLESVSK